MRCGDEERVMLMKKKKKKEKLLCINTASRATLALPAGRDLRLERPCSVKRFLALAAEWPD